MNSICKILNDPTLNKAKQVNSSHMSNIRKVKETQHLFPKFGHRGWAFFQIVKEYPLP